MRINGFIFCTALLLGLTTFTDAYADWVEMKNGDHISGIIIGTEGD